ncbi:hypothetical protein [Streptomyces rubiginosohelvolus]|uniref:hypothetical protein n=1 Tax=Streptomyces rubiginosohelvolus TaxID=67362 RepID=UPI0033A47713
MLLDGQVFAVDRELADAVVIGVGEVERAVVGADGLVPVGDVDVAGGLSCRGALGQRDFGVAEVEGGFGVAEVEGGFGSGSADEPTALSVVEMQAVQESAKFQNTPTSVSETTIRP